jgi:hypothetical protein
MSPTPVAPEGIFWPDQAVGEAEPAYGPEVAGREPGGVVLTLASHCWQVQTRRRIRTAVSATGVILLKAAANVKVSTALPVQSPPGGCRGVRLRRLAPPRASGPSRARSSEDPWLEDLWSEDPWSGARPALPRAARPPEGHPALGTTEAGRATARAVWVAPALQGRASIAGCRFPRDRARCPRHPCRCRPQRPGAGRAGSPERASPTSSAWAQGGSVTGSPRVGAFST